MRVEINATIRQIFEPMQACAVRDVRIDKCYLDVILLIFTYLDCFRCDFDFMTLEFDILLPLTVDRDPLHSLTVKVQE